MPSRKTTKAAAAASARMPTIPKEVIDQFVSGPMSAEAVQDISMAFKKALIERALGAELSHHLDYRSGENKPEGASNHRNGAGTRYGADQAAGARDAVCEACGACLHRRHPEAHPAPSRCRRYRHQSFRQAD